MGGPSTFAQTRNDGEIERGMCHAGLSRPAMLLRARSTLAFGSALVALGAGTAAYAQTTTTTTATTGPTVTLAQTNEAPTRTVNGVVVDPRAQNLTPLGINYSDCISNMVLDFSVLLSGFDGTESLQIWATKTGADCSTLVSRGGGGVAPVCWPLPGGIPSGQVISQQSAEFAIRVQDLIGTQNSPSTTYVAQGAAGCDPSVQGQYTPIPMNIYFVPIDASGNPTGADLNYSISTDIVGPPPPVVTALGAGETLLIANWTPNTDTDTAGYEVFIDPIPGQVEAGAFDASSANQEVLVCPEASTAVATGGSDDGDDGADGGDGDNGADSGDGSASAGASDAGAAAVAGSTDAGCHYEFIAGNSTPSNNATTETCSTTSAALASAIIVDGGASTLETEQFDEAGNLIEAGAVSSAAGISTIPSQYQVVTLAGESNGTAKITGLIDGVTYNVAVAAVDNSGNVGPASTQECDYPAPVNDFWDLYRDAGGGAGGGFCALGGPAVGGPPEGGAGTPVGLALAGCAAVAGALAVSRRRGRRA
jgi:hypothetical protein